MNQTSIQLPDLSLSKITKVTSYKAPFRKQGMRIQHQFINEKHIVHNYGHGNSGIALAYGAAFIAIKAIMIKVDNSKATNVALLGTGITGVVTAIELIKRGFGVTLYSKDKFQLLKMDAHTEKQAQMGHTLWMPDGYDYSEDMLKHELISKIAWDNIKQSYKLKKYRSIQETVVFQYNRSIQQLQQVIIELIFNNFKQTSLNYGNQQQAIIQYSTLTIDNSLYYQQLKTQLILRGGKFITKTFNSLNEVIQLNEQVIVNCLGNDSQKIFQDQKLQSRDIFIVDFQNQTPSNMQHNWHLRVHLGEYNYQVSNRQGRIKVLLPPKLTHQTDQAFVQHHIAQLDSFFKLRRTQTAKL